ncbi:hypothetical protein, partial [Dokdonella sp.]|uniref:hypothetical protein n=1 Tax=Dokdonella sp. TaxID=2291710 RepID=UPI00260F5A8B
MRFAFALSLLLAAPAFAHDHADEAGRGHETAMAAAQPVQTTANGAVYGARLPESAPAAVDLASVVAKP